MPEGVKHARVAKGKHKTTRSKARPTTTTRSASVSKSAPEVRVFTKQKGQTASKPVRRTYYSVSGGDGFQSALRGRVTKGQKYLAIVALIVTGLAIGGIIHYMIRWWE